MTVLLPSHGVHYNSVPKNACTSLKRMFFEIENGRPFEPMMRNGKVFHVHNFYPGLKFDPLPPASRGKYWKIAVVRDPIKRLMSVWRNRVMFHHELDAKRLTPALIAGGLTARPDLDEFALRLTEYCEVSPSIRHHSAPHVFYLGADPAYYDRIYQMSELAVLVAEVGARVGKVLSLVHEQTGGPPAHIDMLGAKTIASLRDHYRRDYQTFAFD